MWAVVPYKGAANAKRRLASALSQRERSNLALTMVRDVIHALQAADCIEHIVLMSKSRNAHQLAHDYGLVLYRERSNSLVDALVEVSDWLIREHGAETTFIVPGDVPLITADSVSRAISCHTNVTVIPDRNSIGTNGLICTPPNAFPYVFDGKSFRPHCDAARMCGFEPRIMKIREFELDIDTTEDLHELMRRAPNSHTGQMLRHTQYFTHSVGSSQQLAP